MVEDTEGYDGAEKALWALVREHSAKAAILATGVLYTTGLLVDNLYLGSVGVTDFSAVRPRYVLIGALYYVVLLLPSLPLLTTPLARLLPLGVRRRRALQTMVTALIVAVSFWVVAGLQLVVPGLSFADSQFAGVWSILATPALPLQLLLINVPVVCIFFRRVLGLSPDSERRALVAIAVGVLLMFWPYANWIYFNVSRSIGGGQPQIVDLVMEHGYWEAMGNPRPVGPRLTAVGPLVLFGRADETLILGAVTPKHRSLSFVQVRASEVHSIVTLPMKLRVRSYTNSVTLRGFGWTVEWRIE